MATPIAGLKTMPTGTTKNEAIFNEDLILLEALTYRGVTSRSLLDPSTISSPAPSNGTIYLVPDGSPNAVGDWASHGGDVAVYYDGWRYLPPAEGLTLWVTDEAQSVQYRSGAWIDRNELPPTNLTDLSDVSLAGSPSPQDGDSLTYNAALGLWTARAFKGARVYAGGATSMTSGGVVIAFNSESYDTDTLHDTSTNNSRINIDQTGKWELTAQISWATGASYALSDVTIRLDGTTVIGQNRNSRHTAGATTAIKQQCATGPVQLTAGSYVEVLGAGSPTSNCATGEFATWFSARFIS